MNCEVLNSTEMREHLRFVTPQTVADRGIFHANSGYINVMLLLAAFLTAIETNYTEIFLRENEEFLDWDQSVSDVPNGYVLLRTSRDSLQAKRSVFVPRPYTKNVSDTRFQSQYDHLGTTYSLFSPEFIEFTNHPSIYSKGRDEPETHFDFFHRTDIDLHVVWYDNTSTCLATFAPYKGFIIDRVPTYVNYNCKAVMITAKNVLTKMSSFFRFLHIYYTGKDEKRRTFRLGTF